MYMIFHYHLINGVCISCDCYFMSRDCCLAVKSVNNWTSPHSLLSIICRMYRLILFVRAGRMLF